MTLQCAIDPNEKLPWGWHFSPTPIELINNLQKKVTLQKEETVSTSHDAFDELREIDLSQVEPGEIKHIAETCSSIRAKHADEKNQYFYTQKEQKYRHGNRSNRATKTGFWKATGRDKPIYSRVNPQDERKMIIGLRKALVFYEGRAPHGTKTDWILHEYRLQSCDKASKNEQWVACHMFIKDRNNMDYRDREAVRLAADSSTTEQVNQQGASSLPESRYHQPFTSVAPTTSPPCEGDSLSLPRLEEESNHRPCPNNVAAPSLTTGRSPQFEQMLRQASGGMGSPLFEQMLRQVSGGTGSPLFEQMLRQASGGTMTTSLNDQAPNLTTGRSPLFEQMLRQACGGTMTASFNDQVPRPLPSFDERPLEDILFEIYDPTQAAEGTFDSLW